MKILITGATGYLGRNLKEFLAEKHSLLTPSHKALDLLDENDVDNYFKSHKIDIVIHCAVVGGSREEEQEENALRNNLMMFFNIASNKKYFKKMIHFGSGAEYDKRFPIVKVKEKDFGIRVPRDEYGFFKYVCSRYIDETDKIINLRIFGLFGKYEDYRVRFISNAICRSIVGLPITLKQNVSFDYVSINDFVKIVEYFIKNKVQHKFYNIGSGKKIDLVSIVEKINALAEKKSKITIKKVGLNNEYTCNNSLLLKELKNCKFTDFDKSLQELYTWYKVNKSQIDRKAL